MIIRFIFNIFILMMLSCNAYSQVNICKINEIELKEINNFFKRNYTEKEWCRIRHISLRNLDLTKIPKAVIRLSHIRSLRKEISNIKRKENFKRRFQELSDTDMNLIKIDNKKLVIEDQSEPQNSISEEILNPPADPDLNDYSVSPTTNSSVILNVYFR